jgi:lipopolysaccharide exporter
MKTYKSITNQAIKGAGWMVSWRFLTRVIGLVSTSILARILTPADFGLFALAYAFSTGISATATLQIDLILLREREIDEQSYSTGFTISVIKSTVTAIIVILLAHTASEFFRDPRLLAMIYCFAFCLFMEGFENVGIVEFRKKFQFEQEFLLFAVPRCISVILSIILAIVFRNYWAMIIGGISFRVSRTFLSYVLHPFRPRFTLVKWRRFWRFSLWMWATGLASFIRDRADTFVVGRMMNTSSLGLFSAAFEIALLPITEILEPLGRVLFPGLSAVYHSGTEMGEAVARSIGAILFLLLPAAIGVSLVAAPIIFVTLGPAWMAGYPLIQIIAPCAIWSIFASVSSSAFVVLGNPRIVTIGTVGLSILRPPLLIIGLTSSGLKGVAAAIVLSYLLEAVYYILALVRLTNFGFWPLVRQLWRTLVSAAVMAALVAGLGLGWVPSPKGTSAALSQLALGTLVGIGSYTSIVFTLWMLCGRPDGPESLVSRIVFPRLATAVRAFRAVRASI